MKMKKLVNMMICGLMLLLSACDAHKDFPDTSMKVGHVLCSDGKVHPLEVVKELKKEPVGVVFYLNRSEEVEGKGYAVYLKDLNAEAFADSIGCVQKTSTSLTALDGNANTNAMFETKDVASPLAISVFDMWRYMQSAYVPSVAQMQLLYRAKDRVNEIIRSCGGDELPSEADECWYWTSTEVSGQALSKAWLFSLASGSWQETPKNQAHKVRPVVTLNGDEED